MNQLKNLDRGASSLSKYDNLFLFHKRFDSNNDLFSFKRAVTLFGYTGVRKIATEAASR